MPGSRDFPERAYRLDLPAGTPLVVLEVVTRVKAPYESDWWSFPPSVQTRIVDGCLMLDAGPGGLDVAYAAGEWVKVIQHV